MLCLFVIAVLHLKPFLTLVSGTFEKNATKRKRQKRVARRLTTKKICLKAVNAAECSCLQICSHLDM